MAMEPNDKIVRSNSESKAIEKYSAKPCEIILLNELDLTATNSKTAMEPRLSVEFLRALSKFPAEAIEAAFRGWRDVSPFFPAVSDIRTLCEHWVRRRDEQQYDTAIRHERQELAAARERGELVDFADIKKELLAVASFPEAPTERQIQQKKALARLHRGEMPPAIQFTKEQIEARKAAERAEIARAENG